MTTYSTFGNQALSAKKSAPSAGFGTASREQAQKLFLTQKHMELACAGRGSPGPAVYTLPPSVGGKQPDGRRADPPMYGFGTASRFRPMSAPNIPAPGHYSTPPASVGPQVLGRFRTEPQMGFGTAERKDVKKVWISQEHMKIDMAGSQSPGPATCGLKSTRADPIHACHCTVRDRRGCPVRGAGTASRARWASRTIR